MAAKILKTGYENAIRSKLGVKSTELPDADINQRLFLDLAESMVIKRVPSYAQITDPSDTLYLENAVMAQICHLLCPSMPRRLNSQVSTIDVSWKKEKIDWAAVAESFTNEYENSLHSIQSVTIDTGTDSTIIKIGKGPSTTANNGG